MTSVSERVGGLGRQLNVASELALGTAIGKRRMGARIESIAQKLSGEFKGREWLEEAQKIVRGGGKVLALHIPHRCGEDSLVAMASVWRYLGLETGLNSKQVGSIASAKFLSVKEGRAKFVPGLGVNGVAMRALQRYCGFRNYPQYQEHIVNDFVGDEQKYEQLNSKNNEAMERLVSELKDPDLPLKVLFTHPEATRNQSGGLIRMVDELKSVVKKMAKNDGVVLPIVTRGMQNVRKIGIAGQVPWLDFSVDREVEFLKPVSWLDLKTLSTRVAWSEQAKVSDGFRVMDAFAVYCLYVQGVELDAVSPDVDPRGVYKPENLVLLG